MTKNLTLFICVSDFPVFSSSNMTDEPFDKVKLFNEWKLLRTLYHFTQHTTAGGSS